MSKVRMDKIFSSVYKNFEFDKTSLKTRPFSNLLSLLHLLQEKPSLAKNLW
jgi:hypothetical protein